MDTWVKFGVIASALGIFPSYWGMFQARGEGMDLKFFLSLVSALIGSGLLFGSVYMAFHERLVNKLESATSDDLFLIISSDIEHSGPSDPWFYKSKLRVVLANKSTSELSVLAPEWIADFMDVPAQAPQGYGSLQLEGERGWHANDWQKESARIRVRPGGTFRLWIGLDPSYSRQDLLTRMMHNDVGTLAIPVKSASGLLEYKKRI